MRASNLRHRVKHQRSTLVNDGQLGQTNTGWVDIKTIFAQVEPQSGTETLNNGAVIGQRRYLITCRNRDINILRDDKLVWKDRNLQVEVPVNSDSIGHWLTFDAFEKVA